MKSKPKPYEDELERRLKKVAREYVPTTEEIFGLRMNKYCKTFVEDDVLGLERSEFRHGLSMSWPEPKLWKIAIPEVVNLVLNKGRPDETIT